MADAPARTPYLGKYAIVLVCGIAAFMVVNAVLLALLSVRIPAGAATIVPPMIAALLAGQAWADDTGRLPENGPAWRFAVAAGAIFLAVQIPLTLFGVASFGALSGGTMALVAGLLAVTTVIVVLSNRWFVNVGAKTKLNQR